MQALCSSLGHPSCNIHLQPLSVRVDPLHTSHTHILPSVHLLASFLSQLGLCCRHAYAPAPPLVQPTRRSTMHKQDSSPPLVRGLSLRLPLGRAACPQLAPHPPPAPPGPGSPPGTETGSSPGLRGKHNASRVVTCQIHVTGQSCIFTILLSICFTTRDVLSHKHGCQNGRDHVYYSIELALGEHD